MIGQTIIIDRQTIIRGRIKDQDHIITTIEATQKIKIIPRIGSHLQRGPPQME